MHLGRHEDETEDEARHHGDHTQGHAAAEGDSQFGRHDPAATGLGQERRGHSLVPVLAGDDEDAEHQGQQTGVVEDAEDVGEPL